MADLVGDGLIKIVWCTTIASTSAPTTAELTAGVDLTAWITPDGHAWATAEAAVDNSALNSVDDTQLPGRRSDDVSETFKHQGDSSAPWTTFASKPTGFLVERTSLPYATAFATGQKLRILPAAAGNRNKLPRAANEVEKFSVKFYKSAATVDQATVA